MKTDATVQFLKLIGVENPQAHKRTGWVVGRCPLGPWRHDGGESSPEVFGAKVEAGDAHTNCFSCGWHGSMSDLLITMRHLNKQQHAVDVKWGDAFALVEKAEAESDLELDTPDIEEMLFGAKEADHVFPDWWLDSFPRWSDVKFARDYLTERNVPAVLADHLDLRADTQQRRVCFPVRDFQGRLRGLHGRAIDKGVDPRYRMYTQAGKNNPLIWLGEHEIDLTRPIVVVEGPFDLAAVKRVYRNVTSPLFSNPSFEKLHRMGDALEWITFYDRGTGGDAGRAKVDAALHKDHVIHHLQPPEGRKDPGDCSVVEIGNLLSPIAPLDDVVG